MSSERKGVIYMDIKYTDDCLNTMIDAAINNAIANLAFEGIVVTDEEKAKFKEEFIEEYKIKVLRGKRK